MSLTEPLVASSLSASPVSGQRIRFPAKIRLHLSPQHPRWRHADPTASSPPNRRGMRDRTDGEEGKRVHALNSGQGSLPRAARALGGGGHLCPWRRSISRRIWSSSNSSLRYTSQAFMTTPIPHPTRGNTGQKNP